ncbi:MAG: hypothetical protein J6R04_06245 [Clostridia bacterium]|nr:hypothetical protein [Clostridia bacterium]
MKKILSFALALLILATTVSMAACGKDKTPDDPDTENPDVEQPSETPDTPADPTTPDEPVTPDEPQTPEEEIVFTTVDEKVQATVTVELRVAPSVDVDNVIGNLRVGEIATRTGVSADWSRIRVDAEGFNDEYYVSSNCLALYTGTTEPTTPDEPGVTDPETPDTPSTPETPSTPTDPNEFVPVVGSETVYVVTSGLNLRTSPTTTDSLNIAGSAMIGAALQRTAKNNEWSRVNYNGKEYYVFSKYVVTKNITGSDFIVLTTPVTTTVTAAQSLHARTIPYFADDPDIDGDTAAGVLLRGATVTVIAEAPDKSWVRVIMADGSEAYVNANYLAAYGGASTSPEGTTPSTPTVTMQFNTLTEPGSFYVNQAGVSAYLQPDVTAIDGAQTLSKNATVNPSAVSTDGEWYKFYMSATSTTPYYVQVKYLTSAEGK